MLLAPRDKSRGAGFPSPSHAWCLLAGLLAILVYEIPWLVQQENMVLRIHDDLEPLVAVQAYTHRHGDWGAEINPLMLGGMPGAALSPEPDMASLAYAILTPFWAYRINDVAIRIVAFLSLYLFLNWIWKGSRCLITCICTGYAFLPFWTPCGLTIAAQPAVMWALCQLGARQIPRNGIISAVLILIVYAFDSYMVYTGPFILAFGFLSILYLAIKKRGNPLLLCGGLGVLCTAYLIANWDLVANVFAEQPIVWHRVEFSNIPSTTNEWFRKSIYVALLSHYHGEAKPFPFIWLTAGIGFLPVLVRWLQQIRSRQFPKLSEEKRLVWICSGIGFAVLTGVLFFIYTEPNYIRLRDRSQLLASINLSRLYLFLPLVWNVVFCLSLAALWESGKVFRFVGWVLVMTQIVFCWSRSDWITLREEPSFKQYKSSELFDEAEKLIGKPRGSVRVACLGLFPSIAHFNDFKTVDGYWYLYPLEFKHRFRKVIAGELEKSDPLRFNFDRWGSRCYLVSAEISKTYGFYVKKKANPPPIQNLEIDSLALKELGADYVFSSVEILNASQIHLRKLGRCQSDSAPIDLFIYEIVM
jgi:hypothetical protein